MDRQVSESVKKVILISLIILIICVLRLDLSSEEEQLLKEEDVNEDILVRYLMNIEQEKLDSKFLWEKKNIHRLDDRDMFFTFVITRGFGIQSRFNIHSKKEYVVSDETVENKVTEKEGIKTNEASTTYVGSTTYTQEELDLLSRLVNAEAESEPYEGKLAVATVVMNRVKDQVYFPNTIHSVIHQQGQFSVFAPNWRINLEPNEDSIRASKQVLEGHRSFGEEVLYFYNPRTATDSWIFSRVTVTDIGNHRFAKNP